jgi:hypothetical protein
VAWILIKHRGNFIFPLPYHLLKTSESCLIKAVLADYNIAPYSAVLRTWFVLYDIHIVLSHAVTIEVFPRASREIVNNGTVFVLAFVA